jgi:hypothetical protein
LKIASMISFLGAWLLAFAASAAPITYNVTVDTSSIAGAAGSLDFNFNPGPFVSQGASLQVLGFATDGALNSSASSIGHVTGNLPGPLTFDNGAPLNDYFVGVTYGSTLAFTISLFGPALATPDGVSTSGSSFVFSLFSDTAGTVPALTSDAVNGFGYVVDVNLDGTTTATNYLVGAQSVPEPGTLALALVAALCGVGFLKPRGAS